MKTRNPIRKTALAVAIASVTILANAQDVTLYESHILPETIVFEPTSTIGLNSDIEIVVKGPDGFMESRSFLAGEPVEFNPAGLPDGTYRYELQIVDIKGLSAQRGPGGIADAVQDIPQPGFGSFGVLGGKLISPETEEPAYTAAETGMPGPNAMQLAADDSDQQTRDQVIVDDLIVDGSACIGMDCVNGENFGFDTLRLKENNTRIKFDDTSSSGSFPNNDWQLTANDSNNGGLNKFSIENITQARIPFTIEGPAPSNSLYVDDGGRIGMGTSAPVVQAHMIDGNTPTFRLHQDGSAGFQSQVWDVAGNEANFFVRDVTNGSALSFRIFPGAANGNALVIRNGNVGVGTASPQSALHVDGNSYTNGRHGVGIASPETPVDVLTDEAVIMRLRNTDNAAARFSIVNGQASSTWTFDNLGDSFRITQASGPAVAFRVFNNGNATFSGDVTANGVLLTSSREKKTDFMPVDHDSILEKLTQLEVAQWRYKHETGDKRHIGPFAEEFRDQFGLGDGEHISAVDLDGISLAAIKALAKRNDALQQQNQAIQDEVDSLREMLQTLTRKFEETQG